MTLSRTLFASAASLSLFAAACATDTAPTGDLALEDTPELDKADHLGESLRFEPLSVSLGQDRLEEGGQAILTSADSFESYFGVPAPTEVDWDSQWVAFYGAGLRNTGGFAAEITSLTLYPEWGGIVLGTEHTSPGFDCLVTQAFTWPHALVVFDAPEPRPTWYALDHEESVRRCGPDNDARLVELAESRALWDEAAAAHGDSYTYSRVTRSFIGFEFATTFVVEGGVVVERHYESKHVDGGDVTTWSETGADLGSHSQGHPIATVDELYAQCETEVLVQDEDENFMNLGFDDAGFLRVCTYTPRLCQDDCSRGPVIADIQF